MNVNSIRKCGHKFITRCAARIELRSAACVSAQKSVDSNERKIINLLKTHGAILERTRVHNVWRLPTGRIWVVPKTPRTNQAFRNNLRDLREALGIPVQRSRNPNREAKPGSRARAVADLGSGVVLMDFKTKLKRALEGATNGKTS